MSLDKQNKRFQQPALQTLFKHVLIMSPCLQLCKNILTLYSTLSEWTLAKSQFWKMGGTNATKGNRAAALLVGKSSKDGWDIKDYSPLCMEGESKVSKLKDKKQITPCWGVGGLGGLVGGQDFLVCNISQSVLQVKC